MSRLTADVLLQYRDVVARIPVEETERREKRERRQSRRETRNASE